MPWRTFDGFFEEGGEPVSRRIYLDFNASTPSCPEAVEAMRPFLTEKGCKVQELPAELFPGIDYHFISREAFVDMRLAGDFLEWAEVHGNLYGTSKKSVEDGLAAGLDIFLDIDVQGARQLRKSGIKALFIFIVPPSWEELERRLRGRGSEATEIIALRLTNAHHEMSEVTLYDHVIVNDRIEHAVDMLRAVVLAERSRNRRSASGEPIAIFETRFN